MHWFLKFIFGIKLYMFRTVPLSIISSFSINTQHWYMSYNFVDRKPVWHIPLLCVQWKTPDDGQRNCPKNVEFYSKNEFEKLVHLVGFITRIYWTIFLKRAQFDLSSIRGTGYIRQTRTPAYPSDNFWYSLAVTDLYLLRERMELFACPYRLPKYCTFMWNWSPPFLLWILCSASCTCCLITVCRTAYGLRLRLLPL